MTDIAPLNWKRSSTNNTLPPAYLRIRATGNDNEEEYQAVGARCAAKLMARANEYAAISVKAVLDWGCGPGRVSMRIASSEINLYGCDVSPEAVAWCDQHIEAGSFRISSFHPPLPYEDGAFDAVLACSVMTHQHKENQALWLKELARVLRPGGVLVASVLGVAVAKSINFPVPTTIDDQYVDTTLSEVVPWGQYRSVLQTEAYTRQAWSEYFEIVAYEEAGLELHDLVTCRKK